VFACPEGLLPLFMRKLDSLKGRTHVA
jgi:hypothetical protein